MFAIASHLPVVPRAARSYRRIALSWIVLSWIALSGLSGCKQDEPNLMRAKQIENRYELIGGPVAFADVGDFLLENDKIRIGILNSDRSWGPGVFGGSMVDIDLRRKDGRYPEGHGRDRFAEVFPLANLMVPAPLESSVKVFKDGSDGKEAVIRVEGKGYGFIHDLYAIRDNKSALQDLLGYKDVKPDVWFRTDYTLRKGESFVRMKTLLRVPPDVPKSVRKKNACTAATVEADCGVGLECVADVCACPSLKGCNLDCEAEGKLARAVDTETGCEVCACSDTLKMHVATGKESVVGVILGDNKATFDKYEKLSPAEQAKKPVPLNGGMGAGDFVFFGKKNKQFVPQNGFDEERDVWEAWFQGRDTFARPLTFDYVAALGGDVSYAYYTVKRQPGDPDPKVAVPVFTSTATPFIAAVHQCERGTGDDGFCDNARVYEYERFMAVGAGDAASALEVIDAHRGTKTGTVKGYVRWADTGKAATNAHVVVLRDPKPGTAWKNVDELERENRKIDGSPGVFNSIDADLGADLVEDGDFEAKIAVGDWVLVAMDEQRVVVGTPIPVQVKEGGTHIVLPSLPTPARIHVEANDETGSRLPVKLTLVALGSDGQPLPRDGARRVYLGQGRLGTGVQQIVYADHGLADLRVAPGRYKLVASRGQEYGIHEEKDFTIGAGEEKVVSAFVPHEVDTTGWISGDFHIHQQPSFDSGMPLPQRVKSLVGEGLDYAVASDHDIVTDFLPWIRLFGLEQWLKSAVGVEITTLNVGHFISFPLKYRGHEHPAHGAVDWYCMSSDQIFRDVILHRSGFDSKADRPTTIIPHPRDGFLGWADQIGLDNYSLTRYRNKDLNTDTQVFRTVSCDHDAMEIFNAKRYDMIRTPTVREIQIYERCTERINRAGIDPITGKIDEKQAHLALAHDCPELKDRGLEQLAICPEGLRLSECKLRHRAVLARVMNSEILVRTKAEQDAWYDFKTDKDPKKAYYIVDKLTKLCSYDKGCKDKIGTEKDERYECLTQRLAKPLDQAFKGIGEALDLPCGQFSGVMEDYFRMLEYGMVKTGVGGSDSHAANLEPGLPRNYIRATTDEPYQINPAELAKNLRASKVVTGYGAFVEASVKGAGPGETVRADKGGVVKLKVKVQTPSWFGVDRLEIYLNGRLYHSEGVKYEPVGADPRALDPAVLDHKSIGSKPLDIVDIDREFEVKLPTAAERSADSWVVVVAMGLQEENWMRPAYLDVPFGELQLPLVASMAFGNVPAISFMFPRPVSRPDFYPVRPYSMTNAVLLDTDGNGTYDAPNPYPAFCSPPCDPASGELRDGSGRSCADIQSDYSCLEPEQRCGVPIPGVCSIYNAIQKGALRSILGGRGMSSTAP